MDHSEYVILMLDEVIKSNYDDGILKKASELICMIKVKQLRLDFDVFDEIENNRELREILRLAKDPIEMNFSYSSHSYFIFQSLLYCAAEN